MLASASQRRGAMVLLAILLAILAIRLALNPRTVPEENPGSPPAITQDLADRLDPNTASPAELAAIPDLGEKRAAAIVQYRQRHQREHPGRPAFRRLSDLQVISGIGPATLQRIEPYLLFPAEHPTQPAEEQR